MPKTQPKPPRRHKRNRRKKQDANNKGRRTKLTPALQERIVTMISGGASYKDAAQANGIGESTFHAWRQRGEYAEMEAKRRAEATVVILKAECKEGGLPTSGKRQDLIDRLNAEEEPFRDFVEAIKKAEAERKFVWLGKIATAADEDWKAAAWLLERIYGAEYARRTVNELVGKDDGPIETVDRTEDVRTTMLERFEEIAKRKAEVHHLPQREAG